MSNSRVGFFSALTAMTSTILFGISLIMNAPNLSFGVCMILSWSYIALTCAFATKAAMDRKALAYTGMALACVYAVFVNLVYFTQLTIVNQKAASDDVLKILIFQPGSLMFAFDILGYGIMALSTFFVGMSIAPARTTDKWLRRLLMIHGIFAPICFVFPTLGIFNNTESIEQTSTSGMIGLVGWCLYFIPIMILSAGHYREIRRD